MSEKGLDSLSRRYGLVLTLIPRGGNCRRALQARAIISLYTCSRSILPYPARPLSGRNNSAAVQSERSLPPPQLSDAGAVALGCPVMACHVKLLSSRSKILCIPASQKGRFHSARKLDTTGSTKGQRERGGPRTTDARTEGPGGWGGGDGTDCPLDSNDKKKKKSRKGTERWARRQRVGTVSCVI